MYHNDDLLENNQSTSNACNVIDKNYGSLDQLSFSANSDSASRDENNNNDSPTLNRIINVLPNSTSSIENNNYESSLNNPSNNNGESRTDKNNPSQQDSSISGNTEDISMDVDDFNNPPSSTITRNLSNSINNATNNNDASSEKCPSNENEESIVQIKHESLQESSFSDILLIQLIL